MGGSGDGGATLHALYIFYTLSTLHTLYTMGENGKIGKRDLCDFLSCVGYLYET